MSWVKLHNYFFFWQENISFTIFNQKDDWTSCVCFPDNRGIPKVSFRSSHWKVLWRLYRAESKASSLFPPRGNLLIPKRTYIHCLRGSTFSIPWGCNYINFLDIYLNIGLCRKLWSGRLISNKARNFKKDLKQ